MHRFYLPPEQCLGAELILGGREGHHGLHVLRLRIGDPVIVLDGVGGEYHCEVTALSREALRLKVLRHESILPPATQITLVQAIPKGKTFETIIQKATELGASRVVPLRSERVVAHLDDERGEAKVDKWRTVAIEAIKQCGNAWLPRIEAPVTVSDLLKRGDPHEMTLIATLQPDRRHPREWFERFRHQHGRRPRTLAVWVGPEGDYTPAEVQAVQAAGGLPISLGRTVLRSDTAAIYCLSVLNYELESGPPSSGRLCIRT